ncbi:MAG: type II/IV secretion system protein [Candidatus Omnitrophica bacterium]|nr:type II/IV secretion system protein [Candidatus Omnitrophota bacterium]
MAHSSSNWPSLALRKGLLTESDLAAAEATASKTGRDLAEVLLQSGKLTEEDLGHLKAKIAGLVFMDVLDYQVDPKALELVPEAVARKHTILPLYGVGQSLTVAITDPWNAMALDEVRLSAKVPIVRPVVATSSGIRKAIDRHYGHKVMTDAAKNADPATSVAATSALPKAAAVSPAADGSLSEVPVAKLVDALFAEALEARASDIHLEPEQDRLRIRFRIDGLLQETKVLPIHLHDGIASRIKLMAKLDITEHRLPQDGHVAFVWQEHPIDLRISTYPTISGENIVIRLMDRDRTQLRLEDLGFSHKTLDRFEKLVKRPNGILLVTGPTGSGKTTTLYAALSRINSVEYNIMTIEDPVEYYLPMIRQTQVNLKAGVTFAVGLRSLLRQDPDVIMVGEIRDKETAEIAIHSALTGHLVLSTLHTNDAVGAAARLADMGVEPYLLSSTLLGVVAQRLVRRVCSHCKESVSILDAIRQRYPQLTQLSRGKGCRFCHKTGFLGRVAVCELFNVDEAERSLIAKRVSSEELAKQAKIAGMQTMYQDGLRKVQEGLITLEELERLIAPDVS